MKATLEIKEKEVLEMVKDALAARGYTVSAVAIEVGQVLTGFHQSERYEAAFKHIKAIVELPEQLK